MDGYHQTGAWLEQQKGPETVSGGLLQRYLLVRCGVQRLSQCCAKLGAETAHCSAMSGGLYHCACGVGSRDCGMTLQSGGGSRWVDDGAKRVDDGAKVGLNRRRAMRHGVMQ
eukprot:3247039-Rhodomonas_salina.1